MVDSALVPESDDTTAQQGVSRRLGVFFFFDPSGIVDDYVVTLLEDMTQSLAELVIVSNGPVTPDGLTRFEQFTDNIIVRDNVGLDVWAYRTALLSYGWDRLVEFDEVVLFNSTIMGPVYPFAEMYAEMDTRDIDFWGITWFHEVPFDPFGTTPEGYIPRHIQSHFHAYRRSLVESKDFQQYWENLPPINGYEESVGMHEAPFTQRFERLGFKSDIYINTEDLEGQYLHPLLFAPRELLQERRCPIFKRRSFFHNYQDVLTQTVGNATVDLYEFLRDATDYDTELIWQNLLRTSHLADLVKGMQLTYALSSTLAEPVTNGNRVALVLQATHYDLLPQTLQYIRSMPEGSDVFIATGSPEMVAAVELAVAELPYDIDVRLVVRRGRDLPALLSVAADLVDRYDVVCFAQDRKLTRLHPGSKSIGAADKNLQNVLASKDFVANVLGLFDREPRLGMLMPTAPNHAEYFPAYSSTWGSEFPATRAVVQDLGLDVPMSADKDLIAPVGTMFWFRTEALRPLLEADWSSTSFPPEQNSVDGGELHPLERAYAYVAQARGYFSGFLYSDAFARIELTNLSYYVQELTRQIGHRFPLGQLPDVKASMEIVPVEPHWSEKVVERVFPARVHDAYVRARRVLRK